MFYNVNSKEVRGKMKKLNDLLQEAGVSKVKLAKYLGVSRQMVYNYLELNSLENWPTEKRMLICKLLGISEEKPDEALETLKINAELMEDIETRLDVASRNNDNADIYFNMNNLSKDEHALINDLIFLIKEKFSDEKNKDTYYEFLYLYNVLQSIDNISEIKYIFAYLSKTLGLTDPNEYKFDENAQFILESIIFTAMNLYNNGGATKSKLIASHDRFVQEIESKKEEALSRTQQINTIKLQALRELGYTALTSENAQEVLNKIAEIETRKVVNK